jgi:hypothetical protein
MLTDVSEVHTASIIMMTSDGGSRSSEMSVNVTLTTQRYISENSKLALSRLMHSIHCGNAIFAYQTLERKPPQETSGLIGCAGVHKNIREL